MEGDNFRDCFESGALWFGVFFLLWSQTVNIAFLSRIHPFWQYSLCTTKIAASKLGVISGRIKQQGCFFSKETRPISFTFWLISDLEPWIDASLNYVEAPHCLSVAEFLKFALSDSLVSCREFTLNPKLMERWSHFHLQWYQTFCLWDLRLLQPVLEGFDLQILFLYWKLPCKRMACPATIL